MAGAEQHHYEARLKELFDGFDSSGAGSLGREELADLCRALHLEEVAPALQETLLQGNPLGRVHFAQFKEALILILSRTLENEEPFPEPGARPEAQPKFVRGGKRYGRRSLPEPPLLAVPEPPREAALRVAPSHEPWTTRDSEEYEAEGQLRLWNPDEPSPSAAPPAPVLEEVFRHLERDGTVSLQDVFPRLLGSGTPPSASTPYRQLKRHLSMQSFDESGRRTSAPAAPSGTAGVRVFSGLDDGTGYACVEGVLDAWHEEGVENSHDILKALDFSLDGKVNLAELTLALENELLMTKNGVHQAALASFKTEIRHLLERVEQAAREKEKLRSDLEKAEKLKSLMASEVDEHHAAIERRNEHNLRKLDEEHKDRVAALKNELRREREQILQQANKQRLELEQEIEKLKTEENYVRDRLSLSMKENSRLESELLETGEKLAEYESLASKLQRNLENVLAEKFGELDPGSAEFLLQEERLARMRSEHERRCRELQDQIDELQSELELVRAPGRAFRPRLRNSLSEEFDVDIKSHGNSGIEPDQGLGSEDCNPLNMSIEAEMVIEQLKEQHHRDVCHLQQELEETVSHYEKQLNETKIHCEKEQEDVRTKCSEEMRVMEKQITGLKSQIAELQGEAAALREQQAQLGREHDDEKSRLQTSFEEEKAALQELLRQEHEADVRVRLEEVTERFSREREELIQKGAWVEEKMKVLVQSLQEEKAELERGFQEQLKRVMETHALEKEELQQELLRRHEREREEERKKMESDYNRRASHAETQCSVNTQTLANTYEETIQDVEGCYQQELHELAEQQREGRSQWESEKDEIFQEAAEAQEHLKERLASEKALSLALSREKELLEKNLKEEVNKLVCEREQLRSELQELREATEKQELELKGRISQLQSDHERELRHREECLAVVEADRRLASLQLERLHSQHKQEKEELNSRLLALETLNKDLCVRAEREKAEMNLEISNLQEKVQKLQREALSFSMLQNHYRVLESEYAKAKSKIASFPAVEPPGDDAEVLRSLQKVHEQAVKENVRMASEIVRLQQRLQRVERGPAGRGAAEHEPSEPEPSGLRDAPDALAEGSSSDTDTGADSDVCPLLGANVPGSAVLLDAPGGLDADKVRELVSLVPLAQKKLRDLERTLSRVPPLKLLPPRVRQNMRLGRGRRATTTRGFFLDASKLQTELEEAEELTGASLRLEQLSAPAEEKGDLENLVAQFWKRIEELEERSEAQAKLLSIQEEIQVEKEGLQSKLGELTEKNKALEESLQELRRPHCEREESDLETPGLGEQKAAELEDVRDPYEQGKTEAAGEKPRLQGQLGKAEEPSVSQRLQCEAEKLREENALLKNEVTLLSEEGSASNLRLRELSGSREEMRQKIEAVRKEKVAVQKMVDNLKKQVVDLKTRNQQLDSENTELSQRNSKSQADVQDLNQQLARVLKQKEREAGKSSLEEWEKERLLLREELENSKIKSSNLVSSLEMELSKMKAQAHMLEQENHVLKQELEKAKQLPRCSDLSDLQNEISSLITKNEKLLKEKEALSEELNRCIDKVAKVSCLESAVASLKQEQKSWEQQSHVLKTQLTASQEKAQSLEETLQTATLQMSRVKADLRVTQQERETLRQEAVSLHKQLQNAHEKNRVLALAVPSSGLQEPQKKLHWDQLEQLMKQEQQLLKHENERLQREVQSTKADLTHAREKIRQLESTVLSLKHQKHQSQSGIVKAIEQEKLSLKRECEQLQRELSSANRKISQMNSLERELETSSENEGLRKKQVKLDDQLMEGGHEQLLRMMEERMMDVEQKLRLVKRLLQDKVNQLKEQLSKNTKADAMVKDLYVENAQLLKALEMTEQRQKTAEKKNYLLEEKIANLNKIVKNLASPSFNSASELRP
ncbi:ninein [Eudromia elegans]